MQKRRWRMLGVLRKLLSCAIGSIGLLALLYAHVRPFFSSQVTKLPDLYKPLMQQEIGLVGGEQSWIVELVPPHLPRAPLPPSKLDGASGILDFDKLWKPPPNRDYVPCVEPSSNYTTSGGSQGYLLVHTNGGLNQMRAGVALLDGITMGGGAGFSIPGTFNVATDKTGSIWLSWETN